MLPFSTLSAVIQGHLKLGERGKKGHLIQRKGGRPYSP